MCANPFTDVVNQAVTLPFHDDSFDLVISLAVTEHVKDPWVFTRELFLERARCRNASPAAAFLLCHVHRHLHAGMDRAFNIDLAFLLEGD